MAEKQGKASQKPEKSGKKPHAHGGKPSGGNAPAQMRHQPMTTRGGKEIRGIVRLAGRDLKGEMPLGRGISRIKGMGERLAKIIGNSAISELKLPHDAVIGELTEEQLNRLEEIMKDPVKYGVPKWMLNRRKDIETGTDKHLIATDLIFTVRQDIGREKEMGTWIGYRHNYGQKVRGQHTRTTGRRGMTVGVLRKSVLAKQGAATAPAAGSAPAAAKKADTAKK